MFFVFEISNPFQIKPGFYRSEITIFRVWWLWFALSLHPGRYDEMLDLSASGVAVWEKSRRTPYALDGATGAAKEQARRNEFLRKYFPSIYPPRK